LDSCSSINLICNKDLINNIESAANPTRAWTNGGFLDYDKTCTLNNIGIKAYYNKDGIENILTMSEICKLFRIPYTEDAVDISEAGFGPQVPIIQGNMIREKQRHVQNIPKTIIPHELVKNNPTDELDMDYCYVNGIVFLHTKFKNIKNLTTHRCVGTGKEECIKK